MQIIFRIKQDQAYVYDMSLVLYFYTQSSLRALFVSFTVLGCFQKKVCFHFTEDGAKYVHTRVFVAFSPVHINVLVFV